MATLVAVEKRKDTGKVAQIDIQIRRGRLNIVPLRLAAAGAINNRSVLETSKKLGMIRVIVIEIIKGLQVGRALGMNRAREQGSEL